MNISMLTLAALLALIPFNSSAQCLLNGDPVPGDPTVIEGTGDADFIDCSTSPNSHDIYGYAGKDLLIGSGNDDFIAGGGNGDVIHGGEGNDAIDGGADNDVIYGDAGNDIIFGGVGSAPASGVGCELVLAAGSSYLSKGGSGDDIIHGGDGDDCIDAGSGEDIVNGNDGNDTLEGGNHGDILDGGLGNDHIDGGWHTDTCTGGGGTDTLVSCEREGGSAPFCGDETCDIDIGENSCTCAGDCGDPPVTEAFCTDQQDNDCDGSFDCADADCFAEPSCTPTSGCDNDGICDLGEDCHNCSNDCAGKTNGKPSGRYCCGDGTEQSAEIGAVCDDNF